MEILEKILLAKTTNELDLSQCGLTEIPKEVFEITNLEKLILGGYSQWFPYSHPLTLNKEPYSRYRLIDQRLREKPYPHLQELVEYIKENLGKDVSKKTVQHDLKEMSSGDAVNFYAPIIFDNREGTYKYDEYFRSNLKMNQYWGNYNCIAQIPADIGLLVNLKYLDLSFNPLELLPEELGNLSKLEEIKLEFCGINSFPEQLLKLKKLQKVDLSSFKDWQSLAFRTGHSYEDFLYEGHQYFYSYHLEEIKSYWNTGKYENKITSIPKDICSLESLISLDLSNNNLRSVPTCLNNFRGELLLDGNPILLRTDEKSKRTLSIISILKRFWDDLIGFSNEDNLTPSNRKIVVIHRAFTFMVSCYFAVVFSLIFNNKIVQATVFLFTFRFIFFLLKLFGSIKQNTFSRIASIQLAIVIALISSYLVCYKLYSPSPTENSAVIIFDYKDLEIFNNTILKESFVILGFLMALFAFNLSQLYLGAFLGNLVASGEKEFRTQSLQEQLNIFSSMQHELGNKLPALKNDLRDISDYLSFKNDNKNSGLLSDLIRVPLEGETVAEIDTVGEILQRMENKLTYSIETIDNLGSIIKSDPSKFSPVEVVLMNYLKEECNRHVANFSNFKINFSGSDSIKAKIDPRQFSFLIHNFISNAVKHGFTVTNRKYFILLRLTEDKNHVYIEVINNGNRLPKGYSINEFIKPYSYSGSTGNSGLGGYLIGNVINNHSGKINIEDKTVEDLEFKVCFKITLPKT